MPYAFIFCMFVFLNFILSTFLNPEIGTEPSVREPNSYLTGFLLYIHIHIHIWYIWHTNNKYFLILWRLHTWAVLQFWKWLSLSRSRTPTAVDIFSIKADASHFFYYRPKKVIEFVKTKLCDLWVRDSFND